MTKAKKPAKAKPEKPLPETRRIETIRVMIEDREVTVRKEDYVSAKTKDLRQFGYRSLTEEGVAEQLEIALSGDESKLTVIGRFIMQDLAKEQ